MIGKILNKNVIIIILFLLVLSGDIFASVDQQKDPVKCVVHYYKCIDTNKFKDAYNLRSERAKGGDSYDDWYKKIWSNNVFIEVTKKKLVSKNGDKAVVECEVKSLDAFPGNRFRDGFYNMTVNLVKSDGAWWIDRFESRTVSYYDIMVPDGYIVIDRKTKPIPPDLPLYPGFFFSRPLLIGKKHDQYVYSFSISKNRLKKASMQDIYKYYRENAAKKEWKCSDYEEMRNSGRFTLNKGDRAVTVWLVMQTKRGNDSNSDSDGIEMYFLYNRESNVIKE